MLQVFLRGGLGNQLFQYSTGAALAEKQGCELILRGDLLPKTEDTIGGVSRWPNQLVGFRHSAMDYTRSHQPFGKTNYFGKLMQVMRMAGDWQPELLARLGWLAGENVVTSMEILKSPINLINSYSAIKVLAYNQRDKLRKELNSIIAPSKDYLDLILEIQVSEVIAVHLRHGDYLNLSQVYGFSSPEYIKSALIEVANFVQAKEIWLFTDTPSAVSAEVMTFLRPKKVIGPETLSRPLESMLLMSKASALVAANSSFSWWAALLTSEEATVCAPYIVNAKVNNFSRDSEPDQRWRILNDA